METSRRSVPEPVGDRQQLVSLLHGLDFGVRRLVHRLVAAPGVIQKFLLRRLELSDLGHLEGDRDVNVNDDLQSTRTQTQLSVSAATRWSAT